MKTAFFLLLFCASAHAQKTIYIDAPPDAQPIKQEITAKLSQWGKVSPVAKPDQADYQLTLQQSEKLNLAIGSGDRGSVVLIDRATGQELWSESRGGAWSLRGFSNASVGRKLGADLVHFLQKQGGAQ